MLLNNSKKKSNKENLDSRILHGLSMEWDFASRQLEISHSYKLKKPLFSLRNLKQHLAFWDNTKREICFSSHFVYNHSWGDIKDVLLHEMAHQLTSECFKAYNEPPHGKSFQKACDHLRANPKASGAYPPLSEKLLNPATDENDKIMFKIQKLMALAESNHIHEAEAAVAKAHQLIEKYNIDMINNTAERNYMSIYIGRPALRHFREEYALANLITEHYFVYGIWVSAYVVEKGKLGRVLEISGTTQNVKIAAYVYDFITNHINLSWAVYNNEKKFNRYRKTDLASGIIEGFNSKLRQEKKVRTEITKSSSKNTPLIIEDHKLAEYTSYKYPTIRNFKRGSSKIDDKINNDGKAIGKKMVISKGIEKNGNGKIEYIPNR